MNMDLFEALLALEDERGIPIEFMIEKIEKAILKACKNNYNGNEDVVINVDKTRGIFDVYLRKTVVEEVKDDGNEISLIDARCIDANADVGEKVPIKLDTKEFGRIAAQTARNIIRQGIRDGERGQMLREFQSRLKEVATALVERIDQKTGAVNLKIGKSYAVLPRSEQIGIKNLKEGDHVKVYILDVKDGDKGPKAILSRSNPEFVKKLFEQEVPEIQEGIVEIKAIARELDLKKKTDVDRKNKVDVEPRTKIAVFSKDENVDAVGACIGTKGARVKAVSHELGGERIDIVEYSDDPVKYIAASMLPAEVERVEIIDLEEKACKAIVPLEQLSLAIGNKGQNARLAAKLTGWKIDVKCENDKK